MPLIIEFWEANQTIAGKGGTNWWMHGRFSIIGGTWPSCSAQVYAYASDSNRAPLVGWSVQRYFRRTRPHEKK